MDILSDKTVKTNKPHMCFGCGRKFEKGTKMRRQVNTCDGICVVYSCKTCDELMTKHPKLFWDDMLEMFNEFCVNESLEKGQTPEELLASLNVA
jgi:uncharacterized protein (DUF2344 family)